MLTKTVYLRLGFLILVSMYGSSYISAQSKFSLTAGIGLYELVHFGGQWNYSEISSLSLFGGTNFGLNNKTSWSTGITFDQTYRRPIVWKLKAGYSLGTTFWTSNDEYYNFQSLAFPAMLLLALPLTDSFTLRIDGGIVYNLTLKSDRKQNIEAGYPQNFNGNFRCNIIYKIGRE